MSIASPILPVGIDPSRRLWRFLFCAWGLLGGLAAPSIAVATPPATEAAPTTREYRATIDRIRTGLDAGRGAEAAQQLTGTPVDLRSFEFDYLQARIDGLTPGAKAAPDLIQKLPKPDVETRYGVLNETNREVVLICRDGSLRVHNLKTSEAPPRKVAHPQGAAVWTGVCTHDGQTFFSGHENGDVLVWDTATWKLRHSIFLGTKWAVRELACAPDGLAFVAEGQKELELWSLAGEKPEKVAGVGDRLNFGEGLAFSRQGDRIATGGMFDIVVRDARTGAPQQSLRHASYTMGLEFSPDGKRIASAPRGNVNKFLAVFPVDQDRPLFNAGPFGNYIAGMAFSPDGSRIAATGCEKVLRLLDATTGEVVYSWPRPECGARPGFSQDGRLLGWTEPDGYRFIDLGPRPE